MVCINFSNRKIISIYLIILYENHIDFMIFFIGMCNYLEQKNPTKNCLKKKKSLVVYNYIYIFI